MFSKPLVKEFLPDPEHDDSAEEAEDEVLEVAGAKKVDVEERPDETTGVAARDTHDAAAFAFATHDAIGNVAYQDARQYRPSRKLSDVF